MKTLNLHCDYIKFKGLKKALKKIDELSPNQELSGESKDCLVVLIAVEKNDDSKKTTKLLVENIVDISENVKTKNIVLYPYAHLSSDLGKPELAIEIVKNAKKELSKKYSVISAPFGYYKEFELKVKGHPLSELSREIIIEGNEEVEETYSDSERSNALRKMSKISMQATKGKDGLKSNVELGKELDLYVVNDVVGQGLPLLTPKGATIKREIERFITDEELKRGYEHTSTPVMAKSDLYKISGHWQHYKKDMFVLDVSGKDYALRPMTCPFQFALFKRKPRTHRDLPKKYAEIASLFRNEQSGELRGLTRARQFTLADAHILCTPDQVEQEFKEVIDLIKFVMDTFNIEIWYQFSRWDPTNKKGKYIDNPKAWKDSEQAMKKILDGLKIKYIEKKGEAAFYGPKLDLQYKDVYGKEDTLITVQIDFAAHNNFDLTYLDKDGKTKPVTVIHRSSTGATERVISYLLEKTQGNLPLWLSPIQVKVMNMHEDNSQYAVDIHKKLLQHGIRSEIDTSNESIGKKARNAITSKVYYLVTVGEKEQKENKVAIRSRSSKEIKEMKVDDFIHMLKEEIENKK